MAVKLCPPMCSQHGSTTSMPSPYRHHPLRAACAALLFMPHLVWLACQSDLAKAEFADRIPYDAALFLEYKVYDLMDDLSVDTGDANGEALVEAPAPAPPSSSASRSTTFKGFVKDARAKFGKKLVALAVVDIGVVYGGVTTILDCQERSLLASMCNDVQRVGSMFLKVLAVAPLKNPAVPIVSGYKSFGNYKSFLLTAASVQQCLGSQASSGTSLREIVQDWKKDPVLGGNFDRLPADGPVVALVQPTLVSLLVAHGHLDRLLFRHDARFTPHEYMQDLFTLMRARSSEALGPGGGGADHKAIEVDAQENWASQARNRSMYLDIADELRSFASTLAGAGADEAQLERRVQLQEKIVWLEGMHKATSLDKFLEMRVCRRRGMAGVWDSEMGKFEAYKPQFLLECIVVSFNLRNSRDLSRVVNSTMHLLPEFWRKTIQEHLREVPTPSASTLTRARLTVDTAYMLWMRSEHARLLADDSVRLYMKLDSTPLQGFNWEVVEYEYIRGEDLRSAGRAAQDMAKIALATKSEGRQLTTQEAARLASLTAEMRTYLFHHVMPLAALGTRQSGVEHILHSVVHRMRLECFDWKDVERLSSRVFSLTIDQGTENYIAEVESVPLQEHFPWWCPLRFDAIADEGDGGADAAMVAVGDNQVDTVAAHDALPEVTFTGALRIPPHFHIIDKITHRFLDALAVTWPKLKPQFQSVLQFFHARHTRQYFMHKCVPEPMHWRFRGGPPAWEGGRAWGVLQKSVHWLVDREPIIRHRFDLRQMGRGPVEADGEDDKIAEADGPDMENNKQNFFDDRDGKTMQAAGKAVQDNFFWAAVHLLHIFAKIFDRLQAWFLSCPCHPMDIRQGVHELRGSPVDSAAVACPMRGRRAPDLAAGRHKVLFQELIEEHESNWFVAHAMSVVPEVRRDLLADFSAGKARIAAEMDIRLSVWDVLPLKLFSLSYPDEEVARQAMLKCLAQYNQATDAERSAMHALTKRVLSPDGPLRAAVVEFVRGAELQHNAELLTIADSMRFVPLVEVSVERLHAYLKQRTLGAHHISGHYCSLQLRRDEILRAHTQDAASLAECCALAGNAHKIVDVLDLQYHHALLNFHADGPRRGGAAAGPSCIIDPKVPLTLVSKVVYRCDLPTQHLRLNKVKRLFGAGQRRAHGTERDGGSGAGAPKDKEKMKAFAYDHFRCTFHPAAFYSIRKRAPAAAAAGAEPQPLQPPGDAFSSLWDALRPPPVDQRGLQALHAELSGHAAAGEGPQSAAIALADDADAAARGDGPLFALRFEADAEDSDMAAPAGLGPDEGSSVVAAGGHGHAQHCPHIFFRVVDARPSKRKRLRTDLHTGIPAECLVVTRHDVVWANEEAKSVTVSLRPSSAVGRHLSQLLDGTVDIESLMVWKPLPEVTWLWDGPGESTALADDSVSAAIGKLLAAQAFPEAGRLVVPAVDVETLQSLELLRQHGVVEMLEQEGEHSQWQLRQQVGTTFSIGLRLSDGAPGLQLRADQPVEAMTMWELIASLTQDGWEHLPLQPDAEAYNVTRNNPKKFYTLRQTPCKSYLQVLVARGQLAEHGIKTVLHGQPGKYYKALLEQVGALRKRPGAQLKLCFDADEDDGRPLPQPQQRGRQWQGGGVGARGGHGSAADDGPDGPPRRARHAKTHQWPPPCGPCMLTFKAPRTWQATCPRSRSHFNPDRPATKCTRSLTFYDDASEHEVLQHLRHWLNQCRSFATRKEHMGMDRHIPDIPEDIDTLIAQGLPQDFHSDREDGDGDHPRRRRRRRVAGGVAAAPAAAAAASAADDAQGSTDAGDAAASSSDSSGASSSSSSSGAPAGSDSGGQASGNQSSSSSDSDSS